ncbi:GNAT family N-acetyltransferase [bacterium]|nr:GNAT family N-acetyltransferase [bacterium]
MFRYLVNNPLKSEEVINLFLSVGWSKNPDDILPAFQNSYYITCYDGDKLIAFARAISDYYYYTNIFDVIVHPDYQKQGIGKEMIIRILEKFKGTYFFLTHTEGKREFYEKCGFSFNQCGMWISK